MSGLYLMGRKRWMAFPSCRCELKKVCHSFLFVVKSFHYQSRLEAHPTCYCLWAQTHLLSTPLTSFSVQNWMEVFLLRFVQIRSRYNCGRLDFAILHEPRDLAWWRFHSVTKTTTTLQVWESEFYCIILPQVESSSYEEAEASTSSSELFPAEKT